jgi:hypothetical protein
MVFKGINSVFGSCSVEIVWTNRTLPNFRFFFYTFLFLCFFFFFLCWIDFYGYRVGELFLPLLIVRAIAVRVFFTWHVSEFQRLYLQL